MTKYWEHPQGLETPWGRSGPVGSQPCLEVTMAALPGPCLAHPPLGPMSLDPVELGRPFTTAPAPLPSAHTHSFLLFFFVFVVSLSVFDEL